MRKILSLLTIRSLFLLVACLFINACGFSSYLSLKNIDTSANNNSSKLNVLGPIQVGAERPTLYLPKLKGKRVGLVVNQTSLVNGQHLVDFLLSKNINVSVIFAPEHGFRGNRDAGEKFEYKQDQSVDKKTGVPLVSIYGKNKSPSAEIMASVDIIIFDIQDVGVRFYTFISSMHYMMAAASDANVAFMVLDRPNPNGMYVDGPMLEPEFQSFVGMHPIPLLHGLTVGELANMIVGEGWLKPHNTLEDKSTLDLAVIPVANYHHNMTYSLAINPSPNLPNDLSIALYPSLGFFEATPISIGRGTDSPFQVIGHNSISLGYYSFMPISTPGAASKPKLMNKQLTGVNLESSKQKGLTLSYLLDWHQAFAIKGQSFFIYPKFMDKLAGTDKLRKAIESGHSEKQIKQSWQQDLAQYHLLRKQYLLYKE
jgi:uncharacterized protein YbbC (DUF1343 family)